jgi:DNA-binding transcriptional ArsR family regulator
MKAPADLEIQLRVNVIKALAHPSRVFIAEALIDGERCVCELTELVGADISTVSKHLSVMKNAGLVEIEKRGLNVYYRLRCPCLMEFFRGVDLIVHNCRSAKYDKKNSISFVVVYLARSPSSRQREE